MKKYVNFIPVCPEVEIGLGIPRDTVRIVRQNGMDRLIQPATGRDVTDEMLSFSEFFLNSIFYVDGFLLKNKSPTSGISDIRVYAGPDKANSVSKRPGFFGGAVIEKFKNYPVEDEGRIRNQRIRENFFTRIFMLADLRKAESEGNMLSLTEFHRKNKMLISSYSQKHQKYLGNIAANMQKKPFEEIFKEYREILLSATVYPPKYTSNINVMMHALGQLPDKLSHNEKQFFLQNLEEYRENRVSAAVLKNILKTWIVRFENEKMSEQTFFEPYPKGLYFLSEEEMERGKDYTLHI